MQSDCTNSVLNRKPSLFSIPKDRFYIIAIVLFLMWVGLMVFFYLKTDEITKNPCQICSEKMGSEFYCIHSSGLFIQTVRFYPNGSYYYELPGEEWG